MKVAVSCDDILKRRYATKIVEEILDLYPDAEMYTLAHQAGAILGSIELRKIHSTFLTHKAKSRKDLIDNMHLIPTAAKNLFIPCSFDLIVNISEGYSHGLRKCDETPQITYLYDLPRTPSSFFKRLLLGHIKRWSYKQLEKSELIIVPTKFVKQRLLSEISSLHEDKVLVYKPPFDVDDYPVIPSPVFTYDHYVINTQGLTLEDVNKISSYFLKKGAKFKFAGSCEHLDVDSDNDKRFFGDRCSGELAPLMSGARAIIDLSSNSFPDFALKGISSGRPVLVRSGDERESLLSVDHTYFCEGSVESMVNKIEQVEGEFRDVDSRKLHTFAEGFHSVRFKSKMNKLLNSFDK